MQRIQSLSVDRFPSITTNVEVPLLFTFRYPFWIEMASTNLSFSVESLRFEGDQHFIVSIDQLAESTFRRQETLCLS